MSITKIKNILIKRPSPVTSVCNLKENIPQRKLHKTTQPFLLEYLNIKLADIKLGKNESNMETPPGECPHFTFRPTNEIRITRKIAVS